MARTWAKNAKKRWGAIALLAAVLVTFALAPAVSADEPEAATPTASSDLTPTPVTSTPQAVAETPPVPDGQDPIADAEGQADPTDTPTPAPTLSPTVTATATLPAPTSTPAPDDASPPTPTLTPTPPGTAHIAVLISEAVLPLGGTKNGEVFVALRQVQPGVRGFELHISFDPAIVQVADADGQAENGAQVTPANWFAGGGQRVTANQADNEKGQIVLAVEGPDGLAASDTEAWHKVATIAWIARAEGKSVIAVDGSTRFIAADGQHLPADAAYSGVVFVRAPGRIEGTVHLQGRSDHGGASVSGVLVAARVDKGRTDPEGRFAIATSHGEGFYTLVASMPGYLMAESDRPIKVTVDSTIDAGEVILLGGDVNGDNRIDVRDLSYIAWHFDAYGAGAADGNAADVNGDGLVDISDLTLTASNFGRQGPTTWQVPDQDDQ